MSISTPEVTAGESVRILVDVTNTGNVSGSYTLTLKINNAIEATQSVLLAPLETRTMSFVVKKNVEGVYLVEIDGLKSSFTVTAPPTPTPIAPPPQPTPAPIVSQVPDIILITIVAVVIVTLGVVIATLAKLKVAKAKK